MSQQSKGVDSNLRYTTMDLQQESMRYISDEHILNF